MGLAAVRARIAGDDFYLLAHQDSAGSARELAAQLRALRDDTGGTLRLRPRTAPAHAPWVSDADRALPYPGGEPTADLTGEEPPGTTWRDVLGSAIDTAEPVDLVDPVALWHWSLDDTAADPGHGEVG